MCTGVCHGSHLTCQGGLKNQFKNLKFVEPGRPADRQMDGSSFEGASQCGGSGIEMFDISHSRMPGCALVLHPGRTPDTRHSLAHSQRTGACHGACQIMIKLCSCLVNLNILCLAVKPAGVLC